MIVMNAGPHGADRHAEEVYDRPADTFVASFIGSPPMNRGSGGCRRALANADRAHQDGGAVEQFPRRRR
jgi:ABC-type sugar transport system ATPase subunit